MSAVRSTRPLFSVVLPVYNKERYVGRAIASVLAQTCSDFEILAVCDPSTDNSLAEVEAVSDPRIRVFRRPKAGVGGYAARNLGIVEAKGEWIAFLDADDEWLPGHLSSLRTLIDEHGDCALLGCGWRNNFGSRIESNVYFRKNVDRVVTCWTSSSTFRVV
jgi:glycosyltransferase involved in cell wall biosynthesis